MSLSATVNRKVYEIESWSWNFRKDGEFGWEGDGVDGVDGIDRVNGVNVIDRSDGVDRFDGVDVALCDTLYDLMSKCQEVPPQEVLLDDYDYIQYLGEWVLIFTRFLD